MHRDPDAMLRTTLWANATFSISSGIIALAGAGFLAPFIGLPAPSELYPTAVSLMIFAAVIFWMVRRPEVPRGHAIAVATLDWLWVLGSIPLVLGMVEFMTSGGRWLIALIALAVADFAAVQTWALARSARRNRALGR